MSMIVVAMISYLVGQVIGTVTAFVPLWIASRDRKKLASALRPKRDDPDFEEE